MPRCYVYCWLVSIHDIVSTVLSQRALEMKAREVVRLTPSLIRHAQRIAKDPRAMKELEELEADISQWAGHVRYLIDATQKANLPWSKTAERLVMAAKTGEGLQTQVHNHVRLLSNTQLLTDCV